MLPPKPLPLLLSVCLLACSGERAGALSDRIEREYIGPARTEKLQVDEHERRRQACETKLRDVLAEPAAPGAPGFSAARAELLARAKAEPVIFVDTPQFDATESERVEGYRSIIARAKNPWGAVKGLLDRLVGRPFDVRDALLRDGYLYAEDPELAYALVSLVQPHDLFGHDAIWIQRGDETLHAEMRNGRYYYKDGVLGGERVRLIHLDRIGFDEPPPPLHRDVRSLAYRVGFDRMKIRHVTKEYVVANLRYGKSWVPSVLRSEGARLDLDCEVVAPHLRKKIGAAKQEAKRRRRVVESLKRVMLDQVDEALPFDEPHHEYGHQLDGKLRGNWMYAYMMRRNSFAFNGDRYLVYDTEGRPLTPQVCVDYLTDTLERASGTWFSSKRHNPGRVVGKLDFDAVESVDRTLLRQVPYFVDFARSKPDWFEVYDVPPRDHYVMMGKANRFYPHLVRNADRFAPGDILVIRGTTPWDHRRMHYHSFFVYESDPVTGIPLIVSGNAGKPSLRSWETEARRTPKRSIRHRLRPKTEWLEAILAREPPSVVLPLAKGPG